jgi:hypothetical protein
MARSRFVIPLSLLLILSMLLLSAPAASSNGLTAALAWLRAAQRSDGGFSSGFSEGSDIGATADAVIAIACAGEAPAQWRVHGIGPIDYLKAQAADVTTPGLAAKLVLALTAAGEDPAAFGGVDLVAVIADGFDPASGFYGAGPYDSALAILALEHAAGGAPAEAIEGLLNARLPDGSYAFDGSTTPGSGDSNTTAVAVQALLAAGAGEEVIPSFDYFRRTQNPDGGWTYQKPSPFGEATDANSTALVIQALLAGGQDLTQWGNPTEALLGLQQSSGALAFNADAPGDNALATLQAIPALAGIHLAGLPDVAQSTGSSGQAATAVLFGAGFLLIIVLALSAVVGRTERS